MRVLSIDHVNGSLNFLGDDVGIAFIVVATLIVAIILWASQAL